MNLSERAADALIGAFVAGALIVVVVAIYFTQGWNRGTWNVYMTAASAEGLNSDTKVYLQGLEIGRVASVSPRFGGSGPLTFLVELELDQRFANDSLVQVPKGTKAQIAEASFVGGASISLETPAQGADSMVQEGDTIEGVPRPSPLGQIAQVADSLAHQVSLVLRDTRTVLGEVNGTVHEVRGQMAQASPHLQSSLASVDAGLRHLEPTLRRAASLAATADSGLAPLQDSLLRTMGAARTLLLRLDTLTTTSAGIAADNRADIRATVAQMKLVGLQLEYFLDQVSRRPLRMVTGIKPMDTDSLRASLAPAAAPAPSPAP
ncbi:MAG TPA: MlaD family protein [Gemmatimonadales bacterium]|jgi:ABC-type transporter Mla subunit MlaD|nr:MlaD family protein [Gemmatimonadales bacterium]